MNEMLCWNAMVVISINGFMILRKCHKRSSYFVCDIFEIELIDLFVLVSAVNTFKGEKKTEKNEKNLQIGWQKWEKCCSKGVKMQFTGFFLLAFDCFVEQLD